MSVSSRFIRVHPDALVEYIWDDNFFYEDEYSIIRDVQNNVSSFAFSSTAVDPDNYNKIPQQLYLVDALINKYGVADPTTKPFLQESQFSNNAPSKFDKIKIWFPLNYVFPNTTGFYLNTYALNYDNAVTYNLSNFFLDITVAGELAKIETETSPLRLYERLWGKSITIYVPSTYTESRNRTSNAPTLGTINQNLTAGILGLSQTTPVFLDFRFLRSKSTVLGDTTYLLTPPLIMSVPQAPEYNNLAVNIEEATDGDYFHINGLYNGSVGEFDVFMTSLEQSGKRSYILYSITVFEENMQQDTQDIYVYKDFFKIIDFRPILKFTTTTASIQVEMKLINVVDTSTISRLADYAITGNAVSKYGKYVTPINVSNALAPKIYNSKPDQLVLPARELIQKQIKKRLNSAIEVKYVPYPVLTNVFNAVAQDASQTNPNGLFYGYGDLNLVLTPFDNIVKINIAKSVNATTQTPFVLPATGSIVQLVFKSATGEVRVPLYSESNEVSLTNGTVVFKVAASQGPMLKKIFQTNQSFYITITTNGIETSIYDGRFTMLQEKPRTKAVLNGASKDGNGKVKFTSGAFASKASPKPGGLFVSGVNFNDKIGKSNLSSLQLQKIK